MLWLGLFTRDPELVFHLIKECSCYYRYALFYQNRLITVLLYEPDTSGLSVVETLRYHLGNCMFEYV